MNNKEKKMKICRLVIFCVLAYLPLYVMTPILNTVCGEYLYSPTVNGSTMVVAYVFGVFGMFAPSVAHILTRLFTKEGFRNTYLGLNLKGNMRYYIASVVVKLLEATIIMFLMWGFLMKGLPFSEVFPGGDWQLKIGTLLMQIAFSVIVFFPAFGEEWGWRGYMMPKLLELMPKPVAVIVGGIIWGLWHAPLTVSGHNFGLDYKFYPWLGILLMSVFCILMNAFLTLLTERTKSVYPAAFCHAINNNLSAGVLLSILASQTALESVTDVSNLSAFWIMLPVSTVTAVVSMVLFMQKQK